jgi:hypothetical protein
MVKMEFPVDLINATSINQTFNNIFNRAMKKSYSQEEFQTVTFNCIEQFEEIDSKDKVVSIAKEVLQTKIKNCLDGFSNNMVKVEFSANMIIFSFTLFAMLYQMIKN